MTNEPRGDWRDRVDPENPQDRTLPEMVLLALDLADEDASDMEGSNEVRLGRESSPEEPFSAREAFEYLTGFDLYEAIRAILQNLPDVEPASPVGMEMQGREAIAFPDAIDGSLLGRKFGEIIELGEKGRRDLPDAMLRAAGHLRFTLNMDDTIEPAKMLLEFVTVDPEVYGQPEALRFTVVEAAKK